MQSLKLYEALWDDCTYDRESWESCLPWCWLLRSQAQRWCALHSQSPWRWSCPLCWWHPQSEPLSPYSSAGPSGCQQSPLEDWQRWKSSWFVQCNSSDNKIIFWFICVQGNCFCLIQDSDLKQLHRKNHKVHHKHHTLNKVRCKVTHSQSCSREFKFRKLKSVHKGERFIKVAPLDGN